MSARMDNAFKACMGLWKKTISLEPQFVRDYLCLCEQLLLACSVVQGDAFKTYCEANGLHLPPNLNHNVWVSGPQVLKRLGWIEKITNVTPTESHNHMPTVTLWRSKLFHKPSIDFGQFDPE